MTLRLRSWRFRPWAFLENSRVSRSFAASPAAVRPLFLEEINPSLQFLAISFVPLSCGSMAPLGFVLFPLEQLPCQPYPNKQHKGKFRAF
jgi:hypothetical protein